MGKAGCSALIVATLFVSLCATDQFRPSRDGWYFQNWGEDASMCIDSCNFSWELYRRTFLGINPTQNLTEAPLDCAFYEIFKTCAKLGNCYGMSGLALALYKYGGYMGFCSPAMFYTGTVSPDRSDLHRAINIMQARQLGVEGIRNFVNKVETGDINNAIVAYNEVVACLAGGDYPVLSIAQDYVGKSAHTIVPYKAEIVGTTRYLYIWDSNHPYDDNRHRYDLDSANQLLIRSATDWNYTSGGRLYQGGWCFCIPMSKTMRMTPQPLSVGFLLTEFAQLLTTGSASVSQISDDKGRRFFKTERTKQERWSDMEKSASRRIPGMVRWPHFDQGEGDGSSRGDLYFFRRTPRDTSGITITLSGADYRCVLVFNGQMVEINAKSAAPGKDVVRLSNIGTPAQTVTIRSAVELRNVQISLMSTDTRRSRWRRAEIAGLALNRDASVTVRGLAGMEAIAVSSSGGPLQCTLNLAQLYNSKVITRSVSGLTASAGENLLVAPENWANLNTAKLQQVKLQKIPGRLF